MKRNIAVLASLVAGAAAAAVVLGRYAPEAEGPPGTVVETAEAGDAADPLAEGVDWGDGPDALARLDAERLRVGEALAAAEAEAARLGDALADAERRATEEAEGRAAAEARLGGRGAEAGSASADPEDELVRLTVLLAERDAELERLSAEVTAQAAEIERLAAELAAHDARIAQIIDLGKIAVAADAPVARPASVADEPSPLPAFDAAKAAEAATSPAAPVAEVAPARADPVRSDPAAEIEVVEVHFDMGSAGLSPGGEIRAAEAAAFLVAMDASAIRLTGHSDTVGSAEANLALSRARAESVADALVVAGIPRGRIEVVAMGEETDMLPVPTAHGVPEPLNRSVGVWAVAPRLAMN